MKILMAVAALSLVTVSCSKNKSSSVPCNKEQVEAFVEAVQAKRDYDKMIIGGVATDKQKATLFNTYQTAVAKFQKTGNSCSVLVGKTSETSNTDLQSVSEKVITIASIQEFVKSANPVYSSSMEMPNGSERPMIFIDATSNPNPPSSSPSTVQDYSNTVNDFSAKTGLNVDLETYFGDESDESGKGQPSFFGAPGSGAGSSQGSGGQSGAGQNPGGESLETMLEPSESSDSLRQFELARIQALLDMIQNSEAIMVLMKANNIKGIEILNPYLSQDPIQEPISEDNSIIEENISEKPTVFQKRAAYVATETLPGKSVAVGELKLYVQLSAKEDQIIGVLAAYEAAQNFKYLTPSKEELRSEDGRILQKQ